MDRVATGRSRPKRRRLPTAPPWSELAERAGTTNVYEPEDLTGHGPDARAIATLESVFAQIHKGGSQFFITNGFLGMWSAHLSHALRRVGTPSARAVADMRREMVALAHRAAALEDSPTDDGDEADAALDRIATELSRLDRRFIRLEPTLQRELAARLDGAKPRASKRPWPRAPRLSEQVRAWG